MCSLELEGFPFVLAVRCGCKHRMCLKLTELSQGKSSQRSVGVRALHSRGRLLFTAFFAGINQFSVCLGWNG